MKFASSHDYTQRIVEVSSEIKRKPFRISRGRGKGSDGEKLSRACAPRAHICRNAWQRLGDLTARKASCKRFAPSLAACVLESVRRISFPGTMGIKLVVFDLDGTLIRDDTCCELIAARIGRLEEMRRFERCTTEDEIAMARLEMSRWYSRYSEKELCEALLAANEAPGLREGIELLRQAGVSVAIASITWSFAVRWFAQRFGAEFHLGTELRADGSVAHVWGKDKARWLTDLAGQLGLCKEQTAAVGDSGTDLPMLRAAGHSFHVGRDRPDWSEVVHLPGGNIELIARELLGMK